MRSVAYSIPEKKYANFGAINLANGLDDLTPMAGTALFYMASLLNGIALGTDVNQRIGRQIYVRYIQIVATMQGDGDYLLNGTACRLAVVHDKAAPNGPLPASSDIFVGGPDGAAVANVTSLRNTDFMPRFSVKYDRIFNIAQLSQGTAGTTYTPRAITSITIPVYKKIQYETSSTLTTTGANLTKDDFYVMMAASTANCCIGRVFWRVCYNDA